MENSEYCFCFCSFFLCFDELSSTIECNWYPPPPKWKRFTVRAQQKLSHSYSYSYSYSYSLSLSLSLSCVAQHIIRSNDAQCYNFQDSAEPQSSNAFPCYHSDHSNCTNLHATTRRDTTWRQCRIASNVVGRSSTGWPDEHAIKSPKMWPNPIHN
jgi:hypothetical protein